MVKCFAWERPDGGISTRYPAYNNRDRPVGDTDEALRERAVARDSTYLNEKYGVCVPHECDSADLPVDDYFFSAWAWAGTEVNVNMTKARVIHMDVIRTARNAELVAKDITFMRAVESGDTDAQSTIATEKQVLRDIPATFDITTGVDTPEKLKAKWPTELPARE